MRPFGGPLHLLFLHEPFADNLVDCRFHKGLADRVALPISLTEVWNEVVVVANVGVEFSNASLELGGGR